MNIVISDELNQLIDEMEQDPNNTEKWKKAATKFGRAQGWKLSKTAFAASKLLPKGPFPKRNYRDYLKYPFYDRPTFYVKHRKPIAIIVHPDKSSINFEETRQLLREAGLTVTLLPYKSGWYQSNTIPILITSNLFAAKAGSAQGH